MRVTIRSQSIVSSYVYDNVSFKNLVRIHSVKLRLIDDRNKKRPSKQSLTRLSIRGEIRVKKIAAIYQL